MQAFPLALALVLSLTGCASQQSRKPAIILEREQVTENSRFSATVPAGWAVAESTELNKGVVQMLALPGERPGGISKAVLVLYGLDGATTLPEARQLLERFGRAQMKGQPVSDVKEVNVGDRKAMFGVGHTEDGAEGAGDYVFLVVLDGDHHLLAVYMGDEDAMSVGLEDAMYVVTSVKFKAAGSSRPHSAALHQPVVQGDAPLDLDDQLGRHLDALLEELMLLSLQPGNDEDENKAVSEAIDAVHDDAIKLYDDLNHGDDSPAAWAPLVSRYLEIRERAAVLITAHGPIRKSLPAPFAEMSREIKQVIELARRELHSVDAVEESRLIALEALHLSASEVEVDLFWSGLRNRHEDLADIQAEMAAVRKQRQELFPREHHR